MPWTETSPVKTFSSPLSVRTMSVDGRAAAQLPARQVEGDVTAQIDAGSLILLPERREALPCEGVEGTVEAEIGQCLGQPLGVGVEVYRCTLQLQRGAVGQVGGVEIALGLGQIDADAADDAPPLQRMPTIFLPFSSRSLGHLIWQSTP